MRNTYRESLDALLPAPEMIFSERLTQHMWRAFQDEWGDFDFSTHDSDLSPLDGGLGPLAMAVAYASLFERITTDHQPCHSDLNTMGCFWLRGGFVGRNCVFTQPGSSAAGHK